MVLRRMLVIMGAALLIGTSCAGSDETAAGAVEDLLRLVPDEPVYRGLVVVDDLAVARDAIGEPAPPPSDAAAVQAHLERLFVGTEPLLLLQGPGFGERMGEVEAWRAEVGYSVLDVDRAVMAGAGSTTLEVVETTVDPDAIEAALRSDPGWSGDLSEVDDDELTLFYWPGGPIEDDPDRATAARPDGRARDMAANDGRVVEGNDSLHVRLAALDQVDPSLADDGSYLQVARALDGHRVHTATLTSEPVVLRRGEREALVRQGLPHRLPLYQVLGVGRALDADGGDVVVVAAATPTEDGAEELVEAMTTMIEEGRSLDFDRPWSETLSVRSATVDGRVATIVLQADDPLAVWQAYQDGDCLFAVA